MNKLFTATAAAALLAASSLTAFAAEVSGTITAVDATAGTVTLEDGTTYTLPAGFDANTLVAGAQVILTVDDGTTTVTAIAPAE
jgi:hypothetical protein